MWPPNSRKKDDSPPRKSELDIHIEIKVTLTSNTQNQFQIDFMEYRPNCEK